MPKHRVKPKLNNYEKTLVGVAGIEPTIWCFTGTSSPKSHSQILQS